MNILNICIYIYREWETKTERNKYIERHRDEYRVADIYIYIYIERERERESNIYVCLWKWDIYIYIYIYIYSESGIYIYIYIYIVSACKQIICLEREREIWIYV